MRHSIKVVFLLGIILFNSCYICKNFTNIKLPVSDGKTPLRTNGVYFAEDYRNKTEIERRYLILYSDGTMLYGEGIHQGYWNKNKFDSIQAKYSKFYNSRYAFSNYGVYTIFDTTLMIQSFEPISKNYRRGVVNNFFKIINDSTIVYYYSENTFKETYAKCESCNEKYINGRYTKTMEPPIEYNFHNYEVKDKYKARYTKKRWYRKNLHESRR